MPFKILRKEILAPQIKLMEIEAPYVARAAKPGQFIVLRIHEQGERIPITIGKADKEKGTLTIAFQEVGKTTYHLGTLEAGDEILDVVGPLGRASEIELFGTVVAVGGGIGVPLLYPIVKALKEVGNRIIMIEGARTAELLVLEDWFRPIVDELRITTDDGSRGRKGFVSDELRDILESGEKIDRVIAVGPAIMMKVVSDLTRPYGIPTIVSLNSIMVDGTGMCGACRVEVDGKTKFACVDGPEMDGHKVDFDLLMKRLDAYKAMEKESLELFLKTKEAKNA
ncbi:MAG: sulfide/dihydroorotate dehydrogenase-like FAD/NAD-binding protein [candidate division WOR-3 bacterium]